LRRDCVTAEQELEKKYEKLQNAPKEREVLEEYVKNVEKNVQSIDLEAKRKNILRRLGGEFDYEKFGE
jgi:CHASE3 domain sensor protein